MSTLFSRSWHGFVSSFLPPADTCVYERGKIRHQEEPCLKKVHHYGCNFFRGVFCGVFLPFSGILSTLNFLKKKVRHVQMPISEGNVEENFARHVHLQGGSDSLFQTCGLGCEDVSAPVFEGRCDWSDFVHHPKGHIKGTFESIQSHFVNYLDDPQSLIQILREMNMNVYRFSLERSVIEPFPGRYDEVALSKYIAFSKALKEAGIEPWITLHHFVEPEWFAQRGSFTREENVENFVRYCEEILPRFRDIASGEFYVKNWMTFNEPGSDILQHYIIPLYPVHGKKGLFVGLRALKNILMAHCFVYQRLKDSYPELQIGITHQWLKFMPNNSCNPIEQMLSHFLSFITHQVVYDFFKTGYVQVPGFMNVKIGRAGLTDFMGVQCYGFPVFKIGFGSGMEPGMVKKWKLLGKHHYIVMGSTCRKGGKVSSFGPPYDSLAIEHALEEAKKLQVPLVITETGADAQWQKWGEPSFLLDDQMQTKLMKEILSITARFDLQGVFLWTLLRDQLEWQHGNDEVCLGIVKVVTDPKTKIIQRHELTDAGVYVRDFFGRVNVIRDGTIRSVA